MSIQIVFDPSEGISERTQFDATPWIGVAGIDFGDATVEPYRAQGERGEDVVDTRYTNRMIGMPLVLKGMGGTSFATARSYFQAKAAIWQREGGCVKFVLSSGGTVYSDVVSAALRLSGDFMAVNRDVDVNAELTLECLPDFYEPEVEAASAEEKTKPELITLIPDPGGDMPARVRVVVEEKQGIDARGAIVAFRSRNYSSAATARSAYQAGELTPLGEASKGTITGSAGTAISNTSLSAVWTPVASTNIGGSSLTHQGNYRVYARLRSPDGTAVAARLAWDVGDFLAPTENPEWRFPGGSAWYIADLGEVRLQAPPVGSHRWQARVLAVGSQGGEDINLDRVWIVNTDEAVSILSAPFVSPGDGFEVPLARDPFNQTAGTITGKVLPLGGTWTSTAGTQTDFTVNTTDHWIERTKVGASTGRWIQAGTATYSSVAAAIDIKMSPAPPEGLCRAALYLRFAAEEFLEARVNVVKGGQTNVRLRSRKAEGEDTLADVSVPSIIGRWIRLTVMAHEGQWAIYLNEANSPLTLLRSGWSSRLASTPAGTVILEDICTFGPVTRLYDNFLVWKPSIDAVCFASQKSQVSSQGAYRLDAGGSAYGPVSRAIGDLPRLPPGGMDNRPVELFVKTSSGDLAEVPDSTAGGSLAVKAFTRRSWLALPGAI